MRLGGGFLLSEGAFVDDPHSSIHLDVNGGSGGPTDTYPDFDHHLSTSGNIYTITLPSERPTSPVSGESFVGWADDPEDPSFILPAGFSGSFRTNDLIDTLYAFYWDTTGDSSEGGSYWSFDANGGQGAPGQIYVSVSETNGIYEYYRFTVPAQTPVREGHEFLGWALSADGDSILLQPGTAYTLSSFDSYGFNVTLYAIWDESSYTELVFTSDPGDGTLSYAGKGGDDSDSNR